MKISAVSVKRPVFAAVISLMLVILGVLSAARPRPMTLETLLPASAGRP